MKFKGKWMERGLKYIQPVEGNPDIEKQMQYIFTQKGILTLKDTHAPVPRPWITQGSCHLRTCWDILFYSWCCTYLENSVTRAFTINAKRLGKGIYYTFYLKMFDSVLNIPMEILILDTFYHAIEFDLQRKLLKCRFSQILHETAVSFSF